MNEDYTLSYADPLIVFPQQFPGPTPVNVTLREDRVAGEGTETITLTLNQLSGLEGDNFILQYDTAVIILQDIDGRNIIFLI